MGLGAFEKFNAYQIVDMTKAVTSERELVGLSSHPILTAELELRSQEI